MSFWLAAFCSSRLVAWPRGAARCLRSGRRCSALLAAESCVGALYALETGRHGRALAIVTGEKIEARVATADNASSVLALPPGSEIKILSTRGDWIYAALPNDLRGWIPAGSAERVRL